MYADEYTAVSCSQAFFYFTRYSAHDAWYLRYLVLACLVFDTTHQALITHTIYIYLVRHFNDPANLGRLVWSLLVEVLFNAMVTVLVQMWRLLSLYDGISLTQARFYVFRIWRLSNRNVWITAPVVTFVVAEFGAALAYTSLSLQLEDFQQLEKLKPLSITVNGLAAGGDLLIAIVLCVMLHTSRTGFKKSDTVIRRLMIYVVNTGLLTSTSALGSLVSIVVWPNAFIYICFYFTLGRLYTNSLLATRNIRAKMTSGDDGLSIRSLSGNGVSTDSKGPQSPIKLKSGRDIAIRVQTTTEYQMDDTNLHDIVFRIPSPKYEDVDRTTETMYAERRSCFEALDYEIEPASHDSNGSVSTLRGAQSDLECGVAVQYVVEDDDSALEVNEPRKA
ncbi:hypothetical protein PUNSTDRAFT_112238 [Punctularia strigosozonata HHB-11173 SS5]|uniref:uncharacterized protein n=1 Tax=Punctularia strigosozonata (strain HHB-11173) TaxID=741275 RepID=UPI00044179F9|nr:uncharacterized protein PUNSTDRAFT_112238 [Punctularia strigosozonata HHB-11173 SS5]EIN10381.1 hypothetical protein PUNSTDRAFT_112238 [Punctularia strigosozonata HHB-11173 SS5]